MHTSASSPSLAEYVLDFFNTAVNVLAMALAWVNLDSELRVLSWYLHICVQQQFPCHYYSLPDASLSPRL